MCRPPHRYAEAEQFAPSARNPALIVAHITAPMTSGGIENRRLDLRDTDRANTFLAVAAAGLQSAPLAGNSMIYNTVAFTLREPLTRKIS